jgi:type I restriction enzyme S subunit
MGLIRPDNAKINYKFLYYYFYSKAWRNVISENTVLGATVDRIPLVKFPNFEIELPPIEIQNKIAEILSAYDDLIENNQKQIKLLEEAAQRLYKEWFVDFRFPGHESTPIIDGIPQGWKKERLVELIEHEIGGGWGEDLPTAKCDQPAYVIRGTDLYDVMHGNARGIPYRYHSQGNLNSRKLQEGDIIFEVSGGSKNEGVAKTALMTKLLLNFLKGDVICASFCKLIRFKNKSIAKYMYDTFQHLRSSGETVKYDKRSASSIVNYRWKDFLEQQFVFIPMTEILTHYNVLAENMQNLIANSAQIIEQAKEVRDRLLPKLMSGELEVE